MEWSDSRVVASPSGYSIGIEPPKKMLKRWGIQRYTFAYNNSSVIPPHESGRLAKKENGKYGCETTEQRQWRHLS